MQTHRLRLELLRKSMKKHRLSAYLVPRQDEFQGEYVAAHSERLKWLTGFSGSWGMSIITPSEAFIFVDGRYTTQVRDQVDTAVFKPIHLIETPPHQWLTHNLKSKARVGYDPWLTTIGEFQKLNAACKSNGSTAVAIEPNLIDQIWEDRPVAPETPIFLHPTEFAGRTVQEKLRDCREAMAKEKTDHALICEPSSVAWLFNIRGSDIPYTPVVPAYAILRRTGKAELFIQPTKVPENVRDALSDLVIFKKPDAIATSLKTIGKKKGFVLADFASAPDAMRKALDKTRAILKSGKDPCTLPKARKNAAELAGARQAHLRDGVAITHFLCWLDQNAGSGSISEIEAANRLKSFRKTSNMLADLSFETIPASGPNAALPHYHADPQRPRHLQPNEIFLIDSGGNYFDGTTDITRTVIIGQPTEEMKDRFTRVLKGVIQVSLLRFPEGTTGSQIDSFARLSLWKAGFDYDHGTGHGVGSFLSVHEGPARISKTGHVALEPGMILSNEPGYYKIGHYGIRIENLLAVTPPEMVEGGERAMLGFETLTLCPIDRRLIDTRMLTREELDWLDSYHARVWRELRPHVEGPLANWLTKACGPLR
jgi:Xaa-Pro aminopeptidase